MRKTRFGSMHGLLEKINEFISVKPYVNMPKNKYPIGPLN